MDKHNIFKINIIAFALVLTAMLVGCNTSTTSVDPAQLVPNDVKLAIFPDKAMFDDVASQLDLNPNMLQQSGSVLFTDNGHVYWLTACVHDPEVLMHDLEKKCSQAESTDNVDIYTIDTKSVVMVRGQQIWACNRYRTDVDQLFAIIERAERASLRDVKVVDKLQSDTSEDSIFMCSPTLGSELQSPADTWLCGRAKSTRKGEVKGWVASFTPSGERQEILEMFSRVQTAPLAYIPQWATTVVAMGADKTDWQTVADLIEPKVPFAVRMALPTLVKMLQPVSGTIVAGLESDGDKRKIVVAQMADPKAAKQRFDETFARYGITGVHTTPTVSALIITNYPYVAISDATPLRTQFEGGVRVGYISNDKTSEGDELTTVMLRGQTLFVEIPDLELYGND